MDWLQFFSSVIGSLAWPATVVSLVIILRRPIARLLSTLTNLKYKDLELDFGRELKKLEERAKAIEVTPRSEVSPSAQRDSVALLTEAGRLAQEFPEPAIAVGWQAVEAEVTSAIERLALSPEVPLRTGAFRHVEVLLRNSAIDAATAHVLGRMRNLRNMAVHGGHGLRITTDEALEFIALARGVVDKLRALPSNGPNKTREPTA